MDDLIRMEIDLDYNWFDTPEMHEEFAKFNLTYELIELVGPAGGNPNLWLIGTETDIANWFESQLEFEPNEQDWIEFRYGK